MSKPYLTYTQQIQKLKDEKGLIINDEVYAEQVLTDIGYFSLIGGYKNLFINPMTRKYEEPTTIEDIISSIQLGATVDYAILFTDRYRECLESCSGKEAISQVKVGADNVLAGETAVNQALAKLRQNY